MPVRSVEELKALFSVHGVNTLYVKHLAANQDNEKNQIYLGGGLDGVANLFPGKVQARSASKSTQKRASSEGNAKLEVKIELAWLDHSGTPHDAPNARIIDYFQYPEVRLSGFLSGCSDAPEALRRDKQDQFGSRILVLGPRPDGVVLGRVLTDRDDPLVSSFPDLPELPSARILLVLPIAGAVGSTPLDLLCAKLRRIVSGGWHLSQILKPGAAGPVPFTGSQGAGYTLEALLGVPANARKAPDCFDHEIKTYSTSAISLMTPSPDGGYQKENSFRTFMEKFGHPGKKADGSRRFTGIFRCGTVTRGFELKVVGYDPASDTFGDVADIAVQLVDAATQVVVASWSLEHLANSWNEKHAAALYIKYEKRNSGSASRQYHYARSALVGAGTDIWRLLRAIHKGTVYFDPAHSIYADDTAKIRPQWRIKSGALKAALGELYAETKEISLSQP